MSDKRRRDSGEHRSKREEEERRRLHQERMNSDPAYRARVMERRKKKKRKKRNALILKIVIVAVLALIVCAVLAVNGKLGKIKFKNLDESRIGTNAGIKSHGVEVIALVGQDTRDLEEDGNSDTMILAAIDNDNKQIKLFSLYRDTYLNVFTSDGSGGYADKYAKSNEAFLKGGPEQFLTMINKNLDLNVKDYVSVNFKVLTDIINALGGLDIDMTREEVIHVNNYNQETSSVAGVDYEEVELPPQEEFDGAQTRTFHLNGSQAVSYARIRYTYGWDQKRASRQRIVLSKIFEKVKGAGVPTMLKLVDKVLPMVETSLGKTDILRIGTSVMRYDIGEQKGFPFDYIWGEDAKAAIGIDAIVPVTLADNVAQLHAQLFPGTSYTPSQDLQGYSDAIVAESGYDESMKPEYSITGEEQ